MQLYKEYENPGGKLCKSIFIKSQDKALRLKISFKYFPGKFKMYVYIYLHTINNKHEAGLLMENCRRNDKSKFDFKKRMYKWFKDHHRKYNLSWYTSKKMMMLAAKALERVFKP